MPTYHDPLTDAAEAAEALRGLAHASRVFDDPADTYTVFGDLVAGVRSLRQVLDQLANAHLTYRGRAHDDHGDHLAGAQSALSAADELHHAGTLLDQVHDRLDAAFGHSGRIAWHRHFTIASDAPTRTTMPRWLSVVFLQGSEADKVLDVIDREGPDAAIQYLSGWDYGEETTDAALENGYVYDEPPTAQLDRVVTGGDYTLTYNPAMGHVNLLRAHPTSPDPALDETAVVSAREAISGVGPLDASTRSAGLRESSAPTRRTASAAEQDWFAAAARPSRSAGRGLSL